jgi:hypothetical protein
MKRKLPSIKKSLIDFVTKEDAKVMDKAFTKIALIGTAISFGALDEVHAADHYNHGNHTNYLSVPGDEISSNTYPNPISNPDNFPGKDGRAAALAAFHESYNKLNVIISLFNPTDFQRPAPLGPLPTGMGWTAGDFSSSPGSVDVPAKSVVAHHANHYNTIDEKHGGY